MRLPGQHVTGHPSTEYVSDETPMVSYMNLHLAFEQMRVKALRRVRNSPSLGSGSGSKGGGGGEGVPDGPPRVLVLGPENAGKTTACKILTNYAVRAGQDWKPTYVNVDPSEVSSSLPKEKNIPRLLVLLSSRLDGRTRISHSFFAQIAHNTNFF